ncbi:hypothetical protein [Kosakonia sp. S42]|nr:hypothetical protein [Kosakonia sp. S42]
MGAETREKEIETWSDFIDDFLQEGGVIYESNEKREVIHGE